MMILRTGKPNAERTRAAFTLIELILVMVLLLVVIAVSAPSLASFFRGRTIESEARRVVSLTRYAQSRAATEGVPMTLWIDQKRNSYGMNEEAGYSDLDKKAVEYALAPDLTMKFADLPQAQGAMTLTRPGPIAIRFTPDGFVADTSPMSIFLRDTRGEELWIGISSNRLGYEIQTNAPLRSMR